MQVCTYAHICKYAIIQVCKYASMEVCTYGSMHIYASIQICKYVTMQVCNYAHLQLYTCLYKKLNKKKERKKKYAQINGKTKKCGAIYMSAIAAFFIRQLKRLY